RDRPTYRHPWKPRRSSRVRGGLRRMAGCAGEPQVLAGDRTRPSPGTLGDARRASGRPEGTERRTLTTKQCGRLPQHASLPEGRWTVGLPVDGADALFDGATRSTG